MNLSDAISRRRSVRWYLPEAVDEALLAEMKAFLDALTPLFPDAKPAWRLMPTEHASYLQKWRNPHFLAFYVPVENEGDGLVNVGYMYQQMDLFLHSRGMGACWVGLGWPDEKKAPPPEGMKLAVMMAFGKPSEKEPNWREKEGYKRRDLEEITDMPDDRLEPVRLAPSACNRQPWFFTHDESGVMHVWREKLTALTKRSFERMNQIDTGIALAHLKVTHPGFVFTRLENPPVRDGLIYMGTVKL